MNKKVEALKFMKKALGLYKKMDLKNDIALVKEDIENLLRERGH